MELPVCQFGDAELWQRFKKGSEEAYACLYERYVSVLYSYGCKLNPDEYLVKDCLQDLFFTLWCSRENLADTDSVKYYLLRSFRREIARKSNRVEARISYSPDFMPDTNECSIEEMLIATEDEHSRNRVLEKALSQLSARQQEAVHLRFYENTSFEGIAGIMNITPRAVYKLIYRAIGALQKTFLSPAGMVPELLLMALLLPLVSFA